MPSANWKTRGPYDVSPKTHGPGGPVLKDRGRSSQVRKRVTLPLPWESGSSSPSLLIQMHFFRTAASQAQPTTFSQLSRHPTTPQVDTCS